MKGSGARQVDKILIFFVFAVVVVLGLKYLKQYIYLSFTLLSLKFVWIILVVVTFLMVIKRRNKPRD